MGGFLGPVRAVRTTHEDTPWRDVVAPKGATRARARLPSRRLSGAAPLATRAAGNPGWSLCGLLPGHRHDRQKTACGSVQKNRGHAPGVRLMGLSAGHVAGVASYAVVIQQRLTLLPAVVGLMLPFTMLGSRPEKEPQ